MTVSNKPGHRGEREVSRKTIARGMPGRSGVTVVTTLVCFVLFRTRDCGRIARPAFPAPSVTGGQDVQLKLARMLRRDREAVSVGGCCLKCEAVRPSLRGAQATLTVIASEAKQSTA